MKSLRFTYKTGAALSASRKILKRRAELSAGYRELIQFAAASLNTDGTHPAIEKAFFIKDNELAATDGRILIRISGQPGAVAVPKGCVVTPEDFAAALKSEDPSGTLYESAAARGPDSGYTYPDIDPVTPVCAEYILGDSAVSDLELQAERVNAVLSCGNPRPEPCSISLTDDGVSLSASTVYASIKCTPVPVTRTVSYPPAEIPDEYISGVKAERLARALTLMELCDAGSVRAHFAAYDTEHGTADMFSGTVGPLTVTVVIVGCGCDSMN